MAGRSVAAWPKPENMSEVPFQVQRFHSFLWASGGVYSDYYIHQIDECSWMKGAWPTEARATGGGTIGTTPWTRTSTTTRSSTPARTAPSSSTTAGRSLAATTSLPATLWEARIGDHLHFGPHAGQGADVQGAYDGQGRPVVGVPAAGAESVPAWDDQATTPVSNTSQRGSRAERPGKDKPMAPAPGDHQRLTTASPAGTTAVDSRRPTAAGGRRRGSLPGAAARIAQGSREY